MVMERACGPSFLYLPWLDLLTTEIAGRLLCPTRRLMTGNFTKGWSVSDSEQVHQDSDRPLDQAMVSRKALSSKASTLWRTPQSITNNWPADKSTFWSDRCMQIVPSR